MVKLGDVAQNIRSKNAGPFWITVDIFCGDHYQDICAALPMARLAQIVGQSDIRRFEIPELQVLKVSFVRTAPQGSRFDRDMHGAQWAVLFADVSLVQTA
ncbi:MAG: DUF4387 family protein [Pseudomonadota bacterium]